MWHSWLQNTIKRSETTWIYWAYRQTSITRLKINHDCKSISFYSTRCRQMRGIINDTYLFLLKIYDRLVLASNYFFLILDQVCYDNNLTWCSSTSSLTAILFIKQQDYSRLVQEVLNSASVYKSFYKTFTGICVRFYDLWYRAMQRYTYWGK